MFCVKLCWRDIGGTWVWPGCSGFENKDPVVPVVPKKLVPELKTLPVLKLVMVGLVGLNVGVVIGLLEKLNRFAGLFIAFVLAVETVVDKLDENKDAVVVAGLELNMKVF